MIDLNALSLKVYDYPGLLKPGDMYFTIARMYVIEDDTKICADGLDFSMIVVPKLKLVLDIMLDDNIKQHRITYVREKEKKSQITWFRVGPLRDHRLIVIPSRLTTSLSTTKHDL